MREPATRPAPRSPKPGTSIAGWRQRDPMRVSVPEHRSIDLPRAPGPARCRRALTRGREARKRERREPTADTARPASVSQPPVHAPNAALLIDFDNVTLGIQKDLTKELRTLLNSDIIKGKVAVQRAYADWRRYPQYIVPLSESSIDLIFAPAFGSTKKNATDIRLAIDAIELVFTRPEIGTFILLSGDSDFSTHGDQAQGVREVRHRRRHPGVGQRPADPELRRVLLLQRPRRAHQGGRHPVHRSATRGSWPAEAVAQMARNGDVMRSDRLKQVMQQIDPNFDERNAGFNRFSKFVLEAGQRGVVKVTKLDNGQFEVGPGTVPPPAAAAVRSRLPPRPGERRGRSPATAGTMDVRGVGGADGDAERERPEGGREAAAREPAAPCPSGRRRALARTGLPAHDPGAGRAARAGEPRGAAPPDGRHSTAGRIRCFDPARFPRLLRQANDAEIADVRKVGEDEYEITARRGSALPPLPAQPAATPALPPAQAEPAAAAVPAGEMEPVAAEPGEAGGSRGGTRQRPALRRAIPPRLARWSPDRGVSLGRRGTDGRAARGRRAGGRRGRIGRAGSRGRQARAYPPPAAEEGGHRAREGGEAGEDRRFLHGSGGRRPRRPRPPSDPGPEPGRKRSDAASTGSHAARLVFRPSRRRGRRASCSARWWCRVPMES